MSEIAQKLLHDALTLTPEERARIAASLIESLEDATDRDVDAAWRAEIRRRLQQIDSGEVETIDWLEARKMILG